MVGTASTVRAFLLVQHPGPWGIDALRDSRLPDGFGDELLRRCHAANVRPLLIRRYGRSQPPGVQVFAAHTDPHDPWLEAARLDDVRQVLDLDLEGLRAGRTAGLDRVPGPVLAVCTHGRHDTCCAELGRPLVQALEAVAPEQTWECSHIGGDRFAANVLQLPQGFYYGRVPVTKAQQLSEAALDGRIDLEHLRGRTGYGFATQSAEWHLRRQLGLDRTDALRLQRQRVTDDLTVATFTADSATWRVTVRSDRAAAEILTCRGVAAARALRNSVVSIESESHAG